MGNECCTVREVPRRNYVDFPDGRMLKQAILDRSVKEVLLLLNLTTDRQVLNCVMDEDKNTAFLLACQYFPTETALLDLFINKGALVEVRNINGETAIHILARQGSAKETVLPSIKYLYNKHHLQLNTKDVNGYDALWNAVKSGDLYSYRFLKSWGCDRDYVDYNGENVLFPAVRLGMTSLVKQMVEYDELDLKQTNKKGQRLIQVAAECSQEIYEYLKRKGLSEASEQTQTVSETGDDSAVLAADNSTMVRETS